MEKEHRDHSSGQASPNLEQAVLRYAREQPQMGQAKVAEELTQAGYRVSASGVRYLWKKHGLETAYKRLQAIRKTGGGEVELTASQRELLRRGDASRRLVKTRGGGSPAGSLERREQILLGAAELFVERGYSGTSIRDIAERVGLLPGSIYHHFPAKEGIFLAVHETGFRRLIARVEEIIQSASDPWERLEIACAEHVRAVVAGNAISRIAATGLFSIHEGRLQQRLEAHREHYDRIFRQLIDDLGLPPSVDRSLFRLNLFGALNWTLVWYRPGKKTPAQIAHELIAVLRGACHPDACA